MARAWEAVELDPKAKITARMWQTAKDEVLERTKVEVGRIFVLTFEECSTVRRGLGAFQIPLDPGGVLIPGGLDLYARMNLVALEEVFGGLVATPPVPDEVIEGIRGLREGFVRIASLDLRLAYFRYAADEEVRRALEEEAPAMQKAFQPALERMLQVLEPQSDLMFGGYQPRRGGVHATRLGLSARIS